MNFWKNSGADTEWRFLPFPSDAPPDASRNSIMPVNCYSEQCSESFPHREMGNVSKPDAVRRVQAKYRVSGGLWLPAKKDDKKEIKVQVSLPEEVMGVFEEDVKKWVKRVIRRKEDGRMMKWLRFVRLC